MGEAFVVDPAIDGPVIVGTGAVFAGFYFGDGRMAVPPGIAAPPDPGGLDALGVIDGKPGFAAVSDGLLYGSIAGGLVLTPLLGRGDDPLGRTAIYVEVLAVNGMITEVVKAAADRPRPPRSTGRATSPSAGCSAPRWASRCPHFTATASPSGSRAPATPRSSSSHGRPGATTPDRDGT